MPLIHAGLPPIRKPFFLNARATADPARVSQLCGYPPRHNRSLSTLTAPTIAESVARVQHSRIRELAEIAMGMPDVLRLYFGESNLPTPEYLKLAADKAIRDGYTYYTENAGLPSLRRAIAEYYTRQQAVDLDPDREIVITASGVQAIALSIRAVLDPGDEAIVLTPAWPNASAIIALANARAVEIAQPLRRTATTPSISMPWKRPLRRAPGCWCTPRHPIPSDGWPPGSSRCSFWNSAVNMAFG